MISLHFQFYSAALYLTNNGIQCSKQQFNVEKVYKPVMWHTNMNFLKNIYQFAFLKHFLFIALNLLKTKPLAKDSNILIGPKIHEKAE